MLPSTLEVRKVSIPFWMSYGHAKAMHHDVSALLCIARGEDGLEGYGEAVPRSYVTGETCESAMTAIERLAPELLSGAADFAQFRERVRALTDGWRGPFPSCGLCALEGAVWDLVARARGVALHALIGKSSLEPLRYTGSIGIGSKRKVVPQILLYKAIGISRFKIKVGAGRSVGGLRLARRLLGKRATFFADANATWNREQAVRHIEELSRMGVWAIEEPLLASEPRKSAMGQLDREAVLTDQHYRDCAWIRERSPIPLIADESLISMRSLEAIISYSAFDILNVRLSKVGGIDNATRMVQLANEHGLRFYIGAMVGESPVLATMGSHFAAVHTDHLAVQGHSHKILHRGSMTRGEPRMRRGGVLELRPEPGLGIELIPQALDAFTEHRSVVRP